MSEKYRNTTGLWTAGAFQSSGMPYVTQVNPASGGNSGISITFPYVTNWIRITNDDSENIVQIGMSESGVTGTTNKFVLKAAPATGSANTTPVLKWKISELYLSGSSTNVTILAGLTNIPIARINNSGVSPSGSNWSGSYGEIG